MLYKGGTASCGEFLLLLHLCLFHGGGREQMTEDTAVMKDRQYLETEKTVILPDQIRCQYLKLDLAKT